MRSGGRLRTYGRIAPMSDKRRAEKPRRDEVRAITADRVGHICQGIDLIPEVRCSGPACDVDEIEGRGVNPGAHLDATVTQYLCRAHHQWKTNEPKLATERGLTRRSTYELRGMASRIKGAELADPDGLSPLVDLTVRRDARSIVLAPVTGAMLSERGRECGACGAFEDCRVQDV